MTTEETIAISKETAEKNKKQSVGDTCKECGFKIRSKGHWDGPHHTESVEKHKRKHTPSLRRRHN